MTSVWPALWPPWKRTTTSARALSQSTILPLPSSPHWAPITATFAISVPLAPRSSDPGTVTIYSGKARPLSGRFWAKRHQHGHAAAIGIVHIGAQFPAQELLLQPSLQPVGKDEQKSAERRMHRAGGNRSRYRGCEQAGVDGMPYDGVRPSI